MANDQFSMTNDGGRAGPAANQLLSVGLVFGVWSLVIGHWSLRHCFIGH
jgi:hypothetical protein